MKNRLKNILFPVVVLAFLTAQILGAGNNPLRTDPPSKLPPDTIVYAPDGYKLNRKGDLGQFRLADSLLAKLNAGLGSGTDSTDTLPAILARDTIKVPDSLRLTDPFRYRYYIALVDSLTHRETVDSLRKSSDSLKLSAAAYLEIPDSAKWELDLSHAMEDSLLYSKIDSIYCADSAYIAKEKFDRWYNSLSRKERKAYDAKMALPAKLKQIDSINKAKAEAKARKDSIIKATPRILETFAVKEEEQYQRLLTWTTDPDFHEIKTFEYDTTFNYRYYDYAWQRNDVNASWLGVAGSPVQYYNGLKRRGSEGVSFYEAYEPWSVSMETVTHFNTKTPYTELCYYGTLLGSMAKESDNLHIFTTQNITPELNFSLLFDRFGGGGILENEETRNKTAVVDVNYLGKRYMAHGGYISNTVSMGENGGIRDISMIRDTIIEPREIEVMLKDASSKMNKKTFYLEQQLRVPFTFIEKWKYRNDSTALAALDSLPDRDITTAFIGHTSEWSRYERSYNDKIDASDKIASAFYNDSFRFNSRTTSDTIAVSRLDNKVFLRLQPWSEQAIVSKLDVGVGDRLMQYRDTSLTPGTRHNENSFYLYAGAEGSWRDIFKWRAKGDYTLLGYNFGDFGIEADASLTFHPFRKAKKSPLSIYGSFSTSLREPDFYQRAMNTNHYGWDNGSFGKISDTRVIAGLDVPRWGTKLELGYNLLYNNIFYDTLAVARQNDRAMGVMSALVQQNVVLGPLHLDNRVLLQQSTNPAVVPVPALAVNLRWYLQFVAQWSADRNEKILEMQLGVDARFNTKWNSPAWNPALGVFYNQNDYLYNNGPYFDIFLNMQWKRAVIFVKYQNAGRGWPMKKLDYFSADRHIITEPGMNGLKIGLYWPFYMDTHSNASKSGGSSGGGVKGAKR